MELGPVMEQNIGIDQRSPCFSALLSPHRSLSPKGFKIVMLIVAFMSFTIGFWFYLKGAWPVLGFFGLDVLILYYAFKANYRGAGIYETIELTPEHLLITHHPLRGERREWRFNSYWVKLNIRERRGKSCQVEASSHGNRLIFADFLSDDEKRDFTKSLNQALKKMRIN